MRGLTPSAMPRNEIESEKQREQHRQEHRAKQLKQTRPVRNLPMRRVERSLDDSLEQQNESDSDHEASSVHRRMMRRLSISRHS